MGSVRRRVGAGFAVLMLLFVALVLVQLFVAERLQADQQRHADRIERAHSANVAVLQHMTDAETGVRGFQLTGQKTFLEPYDSGRVGAFTSFDEVATHSDDPDVQRLLSAERQAAAHWLYAYAYPIVNAGVADADQPRANRGRAMFDDIRTANAAVDRAVRAEQRSLAGADRRRSRYAQLLFAGLAAAFLAVALILATVHQRQLLGPLEHIRVTLRRLAEGDRSARAVPSGPGEMRVVIGTLNDLAAETERLLDAEQARSLRNELRQAVAAELRSGDDLAGAVQRVAGLIGETLGADAVHARIAVEPCSEFPVSWPPGAPALSDRIVTDILTGRPGTVRPVPHVAGALAVPLEGDEGRAAGLLHVVRRHRPVWTDDERRLLVALARELDHAVRQQRLARRQARLISELRVLDERKDAFVATVTHELRTPLTSILGYLEMLGDGDGGELSPLQQRGVSAILRNALRLQDTVADLLLLDRANSGAGLHAPVDLAAVLTTVYAEFAAAAQAKDLVLDVVAEPAWVTGDEEQLQRAVRNLVENAVKFTGAGGRVTGRLECAGDEVVLTVADTGIGIPDGDVAGLFTPFHRAANAMDQAVQGSGLGLAIVRNIVTEHGGTVAAGSVLGEGSTFTLTLPLTVPTGRAPEPVPAEAVR